jgi:SPW repeat-containing protein
MRAWTRWQDWAIVVLGVLLFIAPWVFGTAAVSSGSWDAWILGVVAVILGLLSLGLPRNVATEWITLIVGVLLFISPWVLGFAAVAAAAWSAWIIGILLFVAAGWVLLEQRGSTHAGVPA